MSNSLRDRCASVLVSVTYLTPLVSSAPLPLRCCNVRQTFVERSSCSSPSYTSARTWRACAPAVGNGHKGSVCLSRYPFTSCTSNTLDSALYACAGCQAPRNPRHRASRVAVTSSSGSQQYDLEQARFVRRRPASRFPTARRQSRQRLREARGAQRSDLGAVAPVLC